MKQTLIHSFRILSVGIMALLAACGGGSEQPPAVVIPSTEVAALQTPPPDYPIELACADVGGTVTLGVTVGVEGKPTEVRLVQSSGQPALDASAQERVKTWQFKAATNRGQPVPQTIQVPVTFRPPQPRPDSCFALDEKR